MQSTRTTCARSSTTRCISKVDGFEKRLELKVAGDPLNPSTERQLLTGIAVLTAFLVWRFDGRTN